jgi:hypothetical protein
MITATISSPPSSANTSPGTRMHYAADSAKLP